LLFNDIGFKVTHLTLPSLNDKIAFTGNSIVFNQFVIKTKDNDLVINGKIDSQNFSNIGYDLTLDAVNFKAINSEEDNDLYYGEMYLDNHLRIGGTQPCRGGNIKSTKTLNLRL
jgi:hypothetical protein